MTIENRLLQALCIGLAAASLGLYWVRGQAPRGRRLCVGPDGGASVTGAVARWERSLYLVEAGQGKSLDVNIESLQGVAVFRIKGPGTKGRYLSGAGEKDAAQSWSGCLPQAGTYQIAVASKGGAARYALRVGVSG